MPYKSGKLELYVVRDYVHDIAAAWEIVEQDDFSLIFNAAKQRWNCRLGPYDGTPSYFGKTAPMAICRAFLKLETKHGSGT